MEAATPTADADPQSPLDAQTDTEQGDAFSQHPEIFVGAALLGGLVLAQVLKRLGGGD